jgi:hypothetical protein
MASCRDTVGPPGGWDLSAVYGSRTSVSWGMFPNLFVRNDLIRFISLHIDRVTTKNLCVQGKK